MKRIGILLAVILTARLGKIEYMGHFETWYNLPMARITEKANAFYGINGVYEVREDGVKTYNGLVMCAGAKERYGEIVETSRGLGIILDTGDFVKDNPTAIDMAVTW